MGYFGKIKEKKLAIQLRKKGLSYNQIKEKVGVSKSTISLWCRDIGLSKNLLEQLQKNKIKGAALGRLKGSQKQKQDRINRERNIRTRAIKELNNLSNRDKFISGIALYLGDGNKTGRQVSFTNSNPDIIKFFVNWLREFCNVNNTRLRGRIWIHDNLDEIKAKKFWSELIKIPVQQFTKSYIVKPKTNTKKIRKNKHKYGVFSITVSDSALKIKINTWMARILDN
jgi:transcriptional regulator with XRE-family HTH domain